MGRRRSEGEGVRITDIVDVLAPLRDAIGEDARSSSRPAATRCPATIAPCYGTAL
ncbi:hypothetical protein ACFYNW_24035 [Streptomyces virginiae]|uniref:hypothetical protein n=1 Tax=Streptomyces virginiae TaxID=1961 RepID=UPI0036E8E05E